MEKLGRIWIFSICFSLCENAMDRPHKLNNQHMHFYSLVHILAGLNENQHLPVYIKNYCTSSDFGACPNTGKFSVNPQSPNKMVSFLTPNSQKKHINRSSSIMGEKYQKLYRYSKRILPSNRATLTLRTVFAANSDCRFFRRHLRFMTVAYANSKPLPYCRSTPPLGRSFKSS